MPLKTKNEMTPQELTKKEIEITTEFVAHSADLKRDTSMRVNGVSAKRGSSGKQFAGYTTLEQFYRGDQWDKNEPVGASQTTDNYMAVIIDSLSSLLYDDNPEINVPTDDPTDDLLELQSEAKEKLLWRVHQENDFEVELDEFSKVASLYGDGFLKGPWVEKDKKGKWIIKWIHIDDPSQIEPIFKDTNYKEIYGYIHHNKMALTVATRIYGELAKAKGIKLEASLIKTPITGLGTPSNIPMVSIDEFWTDEFQAIFIKDKLLNLKIHNYGFITLQHVKNVHSPNHAFGKSDIEDVLDPQISHNRTNNDLANLLRWVSTVNLWGRNLDGMSAVTAGLSKIYDLGEDGELHAFERTSADPYVTGTYAQQRRSAIVELSGVGENLLSSSQVANASGRALALAFQGTIRKIGPKSKRHKIALQNLNSNILKLYEIYYPETKLIIAGDYRNEVFIPITITRNIVDTINKLQSGLISQETAMRESGVQQPKQEKKLMIKDLMDPVLGPQVARQPALLPRLSEGQNQKGDKPNPAPGNAPDASAAGAVAANNNSASGGAPTP